MKPAIVTYVLVFFVYFFSQLALAKNVITPISSGFIHPNTYDSHLEKSFVSILNKNHIPSDIATIRFNFQRHELWETAYPFLVKEFKLVEYYNHTSIHAAPGTKGYAMVKEQYEKAFHTALRQAVYQTPSLRKWLNFDMSDRIADFQTVIKVEPSGKLDIKETIVVFNGDGESNSRYTDAGNEEIQHNTNNQIKRGIVRSFPLTYEGKFGFETNTTFELISVLRNGKSEPWHMDKHKNGILLYLGKSDVWLENGLHTYVIHYKSDHQLLQNDRYDEVYWNVTGNGWDFTIEQAGCTIYIPDKCTLIEEECYTGLSGSAAHNCISYYDSISHSISVITTRALQPNEGLTAAVSFSNGFVTKPVLSKKVIRFVADNPDALLFPLAFVLAALVNFISWLKVGRDKLSGTPFPQFSPPVGFPPAGLGYIHDQKFSSKLVAATLLDFGVNRYIRIELGKTSGLFKKDAYYIKENDFTRPLSTSYEPFMQEIGAPANTVIIKGEYNPVMLRFSNEVQKYCEENYLQEPKSLSGFFSLNNRYMIFGNILGLLAGIGTFVFLMMDHTPNGWTFAYACIGLLMYILMQVLFYRLMPSYNAAGQKLIAEIKGFIMYLKAAEEIRLNTMNPPEKTPALYEKYLPFAVALGCESDWSDQFRETLEKAQYQNGYQPNWYRDIGSGNWVQSMSGTLSGSLGGTISSASSPPSSSSGGSFGGGSSGGGGGGGGGGGW